MRKLCLIFLVAFPLAGWGAVPAVDNFNTNNFRWVQATKDMMLQSQQALGMLTLSNGLIVTVPVGTQPVVEFSQAGVTGQSYDIRNAGVTHNDNTGDNAATINAAITNAIANGTRVVKIPKGFFRLTSPITLTNVDDLTIEGTGANSTSLVMGQDGMNVLNIVGHCNRITIKDLWVGAFQAFTNGVGINIVGTAGVHHSAINLIRVTVQNTPYLYNWQYADSGSFEHCFGFESIPNAVRGDGCTFRNVISTPVIGCKFISYTPEKFPGVGFRLGADCDTVTLISCEFGGAQQQGFLAESVGGTTGPRLCRLLSCHSENHNSYAFYVSDCRNIEFIGCEAATSLAGAVIAGGTAIGISDSLFLQNQWYGILVTGGTRTSIEANFCSNNSQLSDSTYDGIRIESGVTDVTIKGNTSGDFIFSLANKQRYGVSLADNTDRIIVTGNTLLGNNTGAIGNFSTNHSNFVYFNTPDQQQFYEFGADTRLTLDTVGSIGIRRQDGTLTPSTLNVWDYYLNGLTNRGVKLYSDGTTLWVRGFTNAMAAQNLAIGGPGSVLFEPGNTGAWAMQASSGSLTTFVDGGPDIGVSGGNRPGNIYLTKGVWPSNQGGDPNVTFQIEGAGNGFYAIATPSSTNGAFLRFRTGVSGGSAQDQWGIDDDGTWHQYGGLGIVGTNAEFRGSLRVGAVADPGTGNAAIAGTLSAVTAQFQNSLETDNDGTGGNTRLLLWDVSAGTFKRVSVGTNDSAGAGFKVLRVAN